MLDDDNEASNYLNQHNLHSRLKEAILELVHHQPERPYAFLRDFFERLVHIILRVTWHSSKRF